MLRQQMTQYPQATDFSRSGRRLTSDPMTGIFMCEMCSAAACGGTHISSAPCRVYCIAATGTFCKLQTMHIIVVKLGNACMHGQVFHMRWLVRGGAAPCADEIQPHSRTPPVPLSQQQQQNQNVLTGAIQNNVFGPMFFFCDVGRIYKSNIGLHSQVS